MDFESTEYIPLLHNRQKSQRKIAIFSGLTAVVAVAGLIGIGVYLFSGTNEVHSDYLGSYKSDSVQGNYEKAAVATDAPYCAPVGRRILEMKGSAMDAAIAVLLCMGVVIPESMGLGGGCIITHYERKTQKSIVFDGRETAPKAATENMFTQRNVSSVKGPLSIGIPGELRTYWEAHQKYGKLPWRVLFDGAIEISLKGFRVHKHLEDAVQSKADDVRNSNLRDLFTNPATNDLYKEGDIMKRPDLAKTFSRIANSTAEIFYTGKIAQELLEELKSARAEIVAEDLMNYKVEVTEAFEHRIGNLRLHSAPLPASGPLLSFILELMSKFPNFYPSAKYSVERSVAFYHTLIEVFKHAYARRALLGDPKFDNVDAVLKSLTSDEYIKYILTKIYSNRTFDADYYGNVLQAENHGTSHVSVVDSEGNVVSASSTINSYFGSQIMSKSTGIIFNDEMDDFSTPNIVNAFGVVPANVNHIVAGKRPLSSMCPTVITDATTNNLKLAIGGAGGTQITTGVALVTIRNLFFKESIKEAIDAPRLHHQLLPNRVGYEAGFPNYILDGLKKLGHKTEQLKGRTAVIVGISQSDSGTLNANSDYRKGGSVDGL